MTGSKDAPSSLTELAARVEAGSGEDWQLDFQLHHALHGKSDTDRYTLTEVPLYCSSLDAVVALIEERLSEGTWECCRQFPGGGWASVYDDQDSGGLETEAPTPVRALLSAFLRALAAQQQSPTEKETTHDGG